MCRNIKTLFNFEPPATDLDIRDACLGKLGPSPRCAGMRRKQERIS
jgi:hypothetical protein